MRKRNRFGNDLAASIPQFWANNCLTQLDAYTMMPSMVYRDFENQLQEYGDTVNARLPNRITATVKDPDDNVTTSAISYQAVPVKLDRWIHTSFTINDSDMSKSMDDLNRIYGIRSSQAIAELVDRLIYAQVYQFLPNNAGKLGGMSKTTAADYLVDARKVLNNNNVMTDPRWAVLTNNSEAEMLKTELFVAAQQVGDNGTALRNGSLGKKYGLNTVANSLAFQVANTGYTQASTTTTAAAVVGATTIAVTSASGLTVGSWILVNGIPYQITVIATLVLTLDRPVQYAIASGDIVQRANVGAVNNASGYAIGWNKPIAYDGTTYNIQIGQLVSFGIDVTNRYGVIYADSTTILLDRPLVAALADNDIIKQGPSGDYNFIFVPEAVSFVCRPLAAVADGAGAKSAVVNYRGLSIRATLSYDGNAQKHRVTLDMLAGVKTLNTGMGAVLFG